MGRNILDVLPWVGGVVRKPIMAEKEACSPLHPDICLFR